MYSFDRTLPNGKVISIRLPRMPHLRANVTYVCDRKCPNCNRACAVAPSWSGENITVEAYRKALVDCKAVGTKLTKLILTGGEPTMHPDFEELADIAMDYKNSFAPDCGVWVSTYHHPVFFERLERAIKKNPGLQIMGLPKAKPRNHDYAPYVAPIDSPINIPPDHFYNGCHLNGSLCGMTVDYKGFYCCPVAPAIARVFNLDVAIKNFADVSVDSLVAQYDTVCRLCGCYTMARAHGKEPISPSWERALKEYKQRKADSITKK